MTDQAKTLRDLVLQRKKEESPKPTMSARVYAIASGKGGVGKSNFASNLAVCMRKLGKRVVIIDADFGLAPQAHRRRRIERHGGHRESPHQGPVEYHVPFRRNGYAQFLRPVG
jgi:Mrp family chromosome partitioning ATPase